MGTNSQASSKGELQASVISACHVLSRGSVAPRPLASVTVALTGTSFYQLEALPFTVRGGSFLISGASTSLINYSDRTTAAVLVNAISVITKGTIACDLTWRHAQCRRVISLV